MFKIIDLEKWNRYEEFHLYTEVWPACLYTVTKKIEVTALLKDLKEKKLKFTPAIFFIITKAINEVENLRYSYKDGNLGCFDELSPLYPVINKDGNLSFHYVNYHSNFFDFYKEYEEEQALNKEQVKVLPSNLKENAYVISNAPFMEVDAFSFNLKNPKYYLLPMVETFKIVKKGNKYLLPMTITVNHATVDLSHVNVFFNKIIEDINNLDEVIKNERN